MSPASPFQVLIAGGDLARQALYERVHDDPDGQLVTGTFVDYALPTAAQV